MADWITPGITNIYKKVYPVPSHPYWLSRPMAAAWLAGRRDFAFLSQMEYDDWNALKPIREQPGYDDYVPIMSLYGAPTWLHLNHMDLDAFSLYKQGISSQEDMEALYG